MFAHPLTLFLSYLEASSSHMAKNHKIRRFVLKYGFSAYFPVDILYVRDLRLCHDALEGLERDVPPRKSRPATASDCMLPFYDGTSSMQTGLRQINM